MSLAIRSETTKLRILAAATTEFATHGLAGARVNRIAAAAGANKERLYAYFGDKQQLFGAVLDAAMSRSETHFPEDASDFPNAVGDLFDLAWRRPELVRLLAWWRLEGSDMPIGGSALDEYRAKLDEIRQAQDAGHIDARWDPADLLAIAGSLATAWVDAPAPLTALALSGGVPPAERRAAIQEAMSRIVRPE